MSEILTQEIAVGDQVRVHFHPPGAWKSFSEGVVRRVDVNTPAGRFFVVEVTHEVILDREHRIRPGFLDYVRYECRNDFPGRIEILSSPKPDVEEPSPELEIGTATEIPPEQEPEQQIAPAPTSEPQIELRPSGEEAVEPEPFQVRLERQEGRRRGGLLSTLFGRRSY
ncbi:hypothetical protein [Microvirga tunisiensis]|uniref:Uncharacterized protein n=1 Tax=Microvirga tunisiensis TaxID=2108360 RepID=A0A5N7MSZ3_9HYPH|nr:hypothetical protein [Microvirga tunisiensis]MPR11783.1 hypothetical protein [Microvirga tunisiensis]MPR29770.1 hypothetical protein [Microvirga tunisiensis]